VDAAAIAWAQKRLELGKGPPATVQHDDVHETNVVVDPSHVSQPKLDWGDAVVSHPFCSMGVTLDRLADRLAVPLNHPWITRVHR
jgi:aminoglycoside phosphotransferase (APT) family kinase protein